MNTTVAWDEISDCYNDDYDKVMMLSSKSTPDAITAVPYILINNIQYNYNNTDDTLLGLICAAYSGAETLDSCI